MTTHVPSESRGDELGMLLSFVEAQRGALRCAVLGLTDEEASRTPTASALSPAGLLKHAALTEAGWLAMAQGKVTEFVNDPEARADEFRLTDGESVKDVLVLWEDIAARTEEFFRAAPGLDVTYPLPPAPWFPEDARVSLRWTLAHLVEEFARHAGHADIVRESLDGSTALDLVQRAARG